MASSLLHRAQCVIGKKILHWLFTKIRIGGLTLTYAETGDETFYGDRDSATQADMLIKDEHLPWEIITLSQIGMGMGYVNETWESRSVHHLLLVLMLNEQYFRKVVMKGYRFDPKAFRTARAHKREIKNSRMVEHCRRQIGLSYDVGNEFYRMMIGPTMMYSCAFWPRPDATLEEAQMHKVNVIIDKLGIKPEHRVLDIGSGWGTLCAHVHERTGAKVRGIALSHNQVDGARETYPELEFDYMDWRDETGRYDRIITVGMIEHVGMANIPAFMEKIASLLEPGGLCLVHTVQPIENILISERHESHPSWGSIILPGVESPTQSELVRASMDTGQLRYLHGESFGIHYSRTCHAWMDNMHKHQEEILKHISMQVFRSHEYAWYLSCCTEVGYNVMQMLFEKQPFGASLTNSVVDPCHSRLQGGVDA